MERVREKRRVYRREKSRREKIREEKESEERVRRKKMQVCEKVGNSRNTLFFH